eukprot:164559-Alexandrium_andersonii.AAC.1
MAAEAVLDDYCWQLLAIVGLPSGSSDRLASLAVCDLDSLAILVLRSESHLARNSTRWRGQPTKAPPPHRRCLRRARPF